MPKAKTDDGFCIDSPVVVIESDGPLELQCMDEQCSMIAMTGETAVVLGKYIEKSQAWMRHYAAKCGKYQTMEGVH